MNNYYFTESKWYGPIKSLDFNSIEDGIDYFSSLPSGPSAIPQFAGMVKEEGKEFRWEYQCPACGGDGKETCNNPDHGFIEAMAGEIGRLGCPGCGHDPNHKVNSGKNTCPECGGYGRIIPEVFEEYVREYGYDEEPVQTAVPIAEEGKQTFSERLYKQLKHIYDQYSDEWTEHNEKETAELLAEYLKTKQ